MGLADFGTIALMAAFALCVYGTVVPHLGVRTNNWNLVRSAQNASILTFLLVALASAILIHALITSDFSIIYVWERQETVCDNLEASVLIRIKSPIGHHFVLLKKWILPPE